MSAPILPENHSHLARVTVGASDWYQYLQSMDRQPGAPNAFEQLAISLVTEKLFHELGRSPNETELRDDWGR